MQRDVKLEGGVVVDGAGLRIEVLLYFARTTLAPKRSRNLFKNCFWSFAFGFRGNTATAVYNSWIAMARFSATGNH